MFSEGEETTVPKLGSTPCPCLTRNCAGESSAVCWRVALGWSSISCTGYGTSISQKLLTSSKVAALLSSCKWWWFYLWNRQQGKTEIPSFYPNIFRNRKQRRLYPSFVCFNMQSHFFLFFFFVRNVHMHFPWWTRDLMLTGTYASLQFFGMPL